MRWILRFRVCIIIFLAVVLITAAVIFSGLRALLPYATSYKAEIQRELSNELGLPVEIESIDAAIHWFSPRLRLLGVSVYDEKNKVPLFNFREAFVELDVIASVMMWGVIVDDIGLIGAELSIEKLSKTEWSIQGIKITNEGSDELPEKFLYMIQNSNYLLHDSDIYYRDHTGEKLSLNLVNVNVDVENSFNNHDIKFSMNLPEDYGETLAVVANLSGDLASLDGDVYIEARQINTKQWNDKFRFIKTHMVDAKMDIKLWGELDDSELMALVTEFDAGDVSVRNERTGAEWDTDFISSRLRFVNGENTWNVSVVDLMFGENAAENWPVFANLQASADEVNYYLSTNFLRYSDVREMADVFLTEEQSSKLINIDAYNLSGDIYNLNLILPKSMLSTEQTESQADEKLKLDASVVDFSIVDKRREIYMSGMDASLHIDEDVAVIDIATENSTVEFPDLFRGALQADIIQGELKLDFRDEVLHMITEKLHLRNSDINTFSRFEASIFDQGKLFIDAQTDFYDARVKNISTYLPVGIMSEGLVDWLDAAIDDGNVPQGSFILYGDLENFPFRNNDGVFEVLFRAKDISLKFLDGWPILEKTSARVKFQNASLKLTGAQANSGKTTLSGGVLTIEELDRALLEINFNATGKNEDLQSYVWSSPLDKGLGDALRLFQLEGKSNLNLKLRVPLYKEEVDLTFDGQLQLIDSALYYPELGYELEKLNGVIEFTRDTLFADALDARVKNKAVKINVFTQRGRNGRNNVFHLEGMLDSDYLLQQFDWLPKPWLAGDSFWSVDIKVPVEIKESLIHVEAKTDLQGVAIKVSDRVNKEAKAKLMLTTSIDVLDKNGLQIEATFAESKVDSRSVELYAQRHSTKLWNFNISSKYLTGKGEFTQGLAKDTHVSLDLENVDLYALTYNKNRRSKLLQPETLPSIEWQADRVLWDDWQFEDVVVDTDWHKHGMLINEFSLKGPAMSLQASGTWLRSWSAAHETVLSGKMSSTDFGETLAGLGFQRSIERSTYDADFEIKWSDAPYRWSWEKARGNTTFVMKQGEIIDVDPGAGGRLLGLLNLFKLTNRLALNFDDVTKDGFVFDFIRGEFEFVNGDGSLKNFDISASAADINIFGKIGLIKQDYGLLMRVKPHTDSLTFAGGTLFGGVVVGAGLALIQKVFDFSVVGHDIYSVTGSWDNPVVEQIVQKAEESADEDDF